jgi:aryl-alcohol dehydrogenase-like predicted oxidoreductase
MPKSGMMKTVDATTTLTNADSEAEAHAQLDLNVPDATRKYVRIAQEAGLTPATMALAFARTRWFTSSVIIGATNLKQLKENLNSAEIMLSAEVLEQIEAVHKLYPNPAP